MNFIRKYRGILIAALVIAALLILVRALPVADWLDATTTYAKQAGPWGVLLFAFVYIVAALLFVPGSLITLAGGATFGLWIGVAAVSVASTATAAIAFLLARTTLRSRVEKWAESSERFGAIDNAVSDGGWKIVGLLRLSPAIPFSMSNYLFGLTSVPFAPYILASWAAMLPGTFLYVYLGVAGKASAEAVSGSSGRSPWEWALLGVGLLATLAVTVYVTKLAKKRLDKSDVPAD